MTIRDLEFSKAERERLQGELNALGKKREKLNEASDALADAERARDEFENSEASSVTSWASSGCSGVRPAPNVERHAALTSKVKASQRAFANAEPALEAIDAAAIEIREKLHSNRQDIEAAAAKQIAADFDALGVRARKLRGELAEIETELAGGLAYFAGEADRFYSNFHRRNPALDLPVNAAIAALPALEPGESQPMVGREAIAKHRDTFEQLQAG